MEEKQELYIVSGTIKDNVYWGEDSDLVWTGIPANVPEAVVSAAIDGLKDSYAEVQPLDVVMRFLRAGEDDVIARDELNREDTAIVEFEWRDD